MERASLLPNVLNHWLLGILLLITSYFYFYVGVAACLKCLLILRVFERLEKVLLFFHFRSLVHTFCKTLSHSFTLPPPSPPSPAHKKKERKKELQYVILQRNYL